MLQHYVIATQFNLRRIINNNYHLKDEFSWQAALSFPAKTFISSAKYVVVKQTQ